MPVSVGSHRFRLLAAASAGAAIVAVGGFWELGRATRIATGTTPSLTTVAADVLPAKTGVIAHVVQLAIPAVVRVAVFSPGSANPREGTGFFINSQGYLLTDAHLVHHAGRVMAFLSGGMGPRRASIVDLNASEDLAILKIAVSEPMPALPLASADPALGTWAVAVGDSARMGPVVTVGVVSSHDFPVTVGGYRYADLMRISNPFESTGGGGGPVLNLSGQVIGVQAATHSPSQGYAIPAVLIKKEMARLVSK